MSRRKIDPDHNAVRSNENVAAEEAKTKEVASVAEELEEESTEDDEMVVSYSDPPRKIFEAHGAEINKNKLHIKGLGKSVKKCQDAIIDLRKKIEEFIKKTGKEFSLLNLKNEKVVSDISDLKAEIQRIQTEKKSVSSLEIENLKKENESLRNEIHELKKSVEEIRNSSGGALSDLEMADAERGRLVSGFIVSWKENGVEWQKVYESEMDAEILANSLHEGHASKLKWAFVDDKNFVISIPTAKQLEKLGKL